MSLQRLWKGLRWTIYILLTLCLLSLLKTEIHQLPEPAPFSGSNWHNPYYSLDTGTWQKANFHAHADVWNGLSNGKGATQEVYLTYADSLGYDWTAISNYQKVEYDPNLMKKAIPAYEHGYGWQKQHQLVLGDDEVSWYDYPFIQMLPQKQSTLNHLKTDNNLVVIAHPKLKKAYSFEDMAYLSGYDCIEVLNHIGRSRDHWDAALSAGKPAYLISSDDTHNHKDLHKSGQNITLIQPETNDQKGVFAALKKGRSVGIDVRSGEKDYPSRAKVIQNAPFPKKIEVRDDTLFVNFSSAFSEIKFVGQDGEVMKSEGNSSIYSAYYPLKSSDTYIRIVAHFPDGPYHLYTNPVFRYESQLPLNGLPTVNLRETRLYRFTLLYILFGLWALIWRFELARARKRKRATKIRWAVS